MAKSKANPLAIAYLIILALLFVPGKVQAQEIRCAGGDVVRDYAFIAVGTPNEPDPFGLFSGQRLGVVTVTNYQLTNRPGLFRYAEMGINITDLAREYFGAQSGKLMAVAYINISTAPGLAALSYQIETGISGMTYHSYSYATGTRYHRPPVYEFRDAMEVLFEDDFLATQPQGDTVRLFLLSEQIANDPNGAIELQIMQVCLQLTNATPTPLPTDTPAPSRTPSRTPIPTNTPTGTLPPTRTPTRTPLPTNTRNPSITPEPSQTRTPRPTNGPGTATDLPDTPGPTGIAPIVRGTVRAFKTPSLCGSPINPCGAGFAYPDLPALDALSSPTLYAGGFFTTATIEGLQGAVGELDQIESMATLQYTDLDGRVITIGQQFSEYGRNIGQFFAMARAMIRPRDLYMGASAQGLEGLDSPAPDSVSYSLISFIFTALAVVMLLTALFFVLRVVKFILMVFRII